MYRKDLKVLVHRKQCIFKSIKVLSDYEKVNGKYQFNSVAQSHLTLCNPMDCNTPGLPVHHARLPCPSPTPGACSDSYPLSQWCHSIISSSVIPFSCLQSFPASGSFPISQFFTSCGQSIGASASASVLPISGLISFRIDWFDLLAVQRTLKSLL